MLELFKCIIELKAFPILKNNKVMYRNRRTGKMFPAKNENCARLMDILTLELIKAKNMAKLDTIDCDVNVSFQFFYPFNLFFNKKNKRSKKVADIGNLYQAIEDCLQKSSVLLNDSLIESHDGSGRFPITEDKHILKIVITKKERSYA